MSTQMTSGTTVLLFGDAPIPRPLARLAVRRADGADAIDQAVADSRRLVVMGSDAELAGVLSRLMRTEALDVEVAHMRSGSWLAARRAVAGTARRVPLIRDDTGTVLVGAALWLPPQDGTTLHGEAVVDDTVLFDGDVAGVRIEPTSAQPGLRAAVLNGPRRRWVAGRAAQLGTTGALVVRDGVTGSRLVKRSTFYRHTTGWLMVQ